MRTDPKPPSANPFCEVLSKQRYETGHEPNKPHYTVELNPDHRPLLVIHGILKADRPRHKTMMGPRVRADLQYICDSAEGDLKAAAALILRYLQIGNRSAAVRGTRWTPRQLSRLCSGVVRNGTGYLIWRFSKPASTSHRVP